jgi:2-polyprenyl-6-methoxyphenol hydroxylase-like FAD-dependent oxidoreductase
MDFVSGRYCGLCPVVDVMTQLFSGPRVPEHRCHTREETTLVESLSWQVLVGDAAHACYNYAGQGTNLALEDGLILENILVQELDVSG